MTKFEFGKKGSAEIVNEFNGMQIKVCENGFQSTLINVGSVDQANAMIKALEEYKQAVEQGLIQESGV